MSVLPPEFTVLLNDPLVVATLEALRTHTAEQDETVLVQKVLTCSATRELFEPLAEAQAFDSVKVGVLLAFPHFDYADLNDYPNVLPTAVHSVLLAVAEYGFDQANLELVEGADRGLHQYVVEMRLAYHAALLRAVTRIQINGLNPVIEMTQAINQGLIDKSYHQLVAPALMEVYLADVEKLIENVRQQDVNSMNVVPEALISSLQKGVHRLRGLPDEDKLRAEAEARAAARRKARYDKLRENGHQRRFRL